MKPTLLLILAVFLAVGCAQPLPAAPANPPPATLTALQEPHSDQAGQHAYQVEVDGEVVRFLLYLPQSYIGSGATRKYPLILFLHGSGQGGDQVEDVAATGLPQRLQQLQDEKEFPFIVVSPQLPDPSQGCRAQNIDDYMVQCGWGRYVDRLEGLLDWLELRTEVDPQREYLTGLSMGGFGTWEYALRYPRRFAALAPIAGGLEFSQESAPTGICSLKDLPIWAFHGEKDSTVSPNYTTVLIEALRKCESSPKLTLYPNEGHSGSWTSAYNNQELYDWLLAHHN